MALMASYQDSRMTQHRIKNIVYYLRNFGLDAIRRPFFILCPAFDERIPLFFTKSLSYYKKSGNTGS